MTSALLLACIGFRIWLYFSKSREDYSFWFNFWRFAAMPAACLAVVAGQFQNLPSSGWLAIGIPVYLVCLFCSF